MEEFKLEIKQDIENINNKLDHILSLLNKQDKINDKLDTHIDFIEYTYSTLRFPLNFLKEKINTLAGKNRILENETTLNIDN